LDSTACARLGSSTVGPRTDLTFFGFQNQRYSSTSNAVSNSSEPIP
jgi:hypothetical protein